MLPVWAWVLVALVLAITVLALLHYFANPNFIDVKGRAYLITGGSSGIGKAVAKDILSKGGSVALVARKQAGLDEAQAELAGGDEGVRARISLHAADIMDEEAVKAAVEGAADAHGRLDGVVSSAGTSLPRLFEAISAEQWEWMLRLNVVGTRNVIAASLPHLKASDAGRIVMVSSSAGQVGVFGFTLYS
ncbi:TSC10B, partial [Symbiodinium sp. KB8]